MFITWFVLFIVSLTLIGLVSLRRDKVRKMRVARAMAFHPAGKGR